ncbi:hypothetical protein TRVA0_011S00254 [Trichomonascus vanleenenianus]|uniref:uncharacterized protein n=1 Tax=Trichomonascus vanleenenianus TaxID=2268995 RepID=UPI003EC9CE35
MAKKIAVLGLNGYLGRDVINSLLDVKYRKDVALPLRAITRDASKFSSSDEIEYIQATLDDKESLLKALNGVDTLIVLTNAAVNVDSAIDAAVENKVKLFIPSEFGTDYRHSTSKKPFQSKIDTVAYAQGKGLKTVSVLNGLFGDMLVNIPAVIGIKAQTNSFERFGDGDAKLSVSFSSDIGNSVAELATTEHPEQLPDYVRIQSDVVSFNEIANAYERYKGVKLEVEQKSNEELFDAANRFLETGEGGRAGFTSFVKANINAAPNSMNFSKENDNDLVNPGKFQWTSFLSKAEKHWSA